MERGARGQVICGRERMRWAWQGVVHAELVGMRPDQVCGTAGTVGYLRM